MKRKKVVMEVKSLDEFLRYIEGNEAFDVKMVRSGFAQVNFDVLKCELLVSETPRGRDVTEMFGGGSVTEPQVISSLAQAKFMLHSGQDKATDVQYITVPAVS